MKRGGIVAQLARARGSYPRGHWFEPSLCYFEGLWRSGSAEDS